MIILFQSESGLDLSGGGVVFLFWVSVTCVG